MWLPLLYQPRRLLQALSLARAVPRSPPCMYSVTIITCNPRLNLMIAWEVTTLKEWQISLSRSGVREGERWLGPCQLSCNTVAETLTSRLLCGGMVSQR